MRWQTLDGVRKVIWCRGKERWRWRGLSTYSGHVEPAGRRIEGGRWNRFCSVWGGWYGEVTAQTEDVEVFGKRKESGGGWAWDYFAQLHLMGTPDRLNSLSQD